VGSAWKGLVGEGGRSGIARVSALLLLRGSKI